MGMTYSSTEIGSGIYSFSLIDLKGSKGMKAGSGPNGSESFLWGEGGTTGT